MAGPKSEVGVVQKCVAGNICPQWDFDVDLVRKFILRVLRKSRPARPDRLAAPIISLVAKARAGRTTPWSNSGP